MKCNMKRLSLIFLGSTGAGPVYSLEMAKALAATGRFKLQIIISKRVLNKEEWIKSLNTDNIQLIEIDTYAHNYLSVLMSFFEFWKHIKLIKAIRLFSPDYIYMPFGMLWGPVIYPYLPFYSKILTTIHDPHPHDQVKNPLVNLYDTWCDRSIKKYIDGIIILNKTDIEYVMSKYLKEVYVIPHASFSYYTQQNICDTGNNDIKYTIGFFGRIEPYKGLDILLDAYDSLSDLNLKLLIAGSGTIDPELFARIQKNDKIELINRYINDDEFSGLMYQVDFVVLPYKRASQSGVIPMAYAFGKPVISTNVGSLSEQVTEDTGKVVLPDSLSISLAIREFYNDLDLIIKYGKKAKQYAESELSWDKSAKLLIEACESQYDN